MVDTFLPFDVILFSEYCLDAAAWICVARDRKGLQPPVKFQYPFSKVFWMGIAAWRALLGTQHAASNNNRLASLTSINFSKSLSRLAKFSFLLLLSAIKPCFFLSRPWRRSSSICRSSCSWLMRAIISWFSSSPTCSGCFSKNSSTDKSGSCWYLWL